MAQRHALHVERTAEKASILSDRVWLSSAEARVEGRVGGSVGVGEGIPLGPLGFEGAQHRQTLRPSRRRDPQQSPASFRIAVKDLEDPAVQCRWLAVSG